MRAEILALALVVGGFVWAFRVLPMRLDLARIPQSGVLARFIAATGVAAITTLFAAGFLPEIAAGRQGPAVMGSLAVVGVYLLSRSVVGATLAGAAAYGVVFGIWG